MAEEPALTPEQRETLRMLHKKCFTMGYFPFSWLHTSKWRASSDTGRPPHLTGGALGGISASFDQPSSSPILPLLFFNYGVGREWLPESGLSSSTQQRDGVSWFCGSTTRGAKH